MKVTNYIKVAVAAALLTNITISNAGETACGYDGNTSSVTETVNMETQVVTFQSSALFDFDSDVIKPEGMAQLDAFVEKLSSATSIEAMTIVGHTDSKGSEEYNDALSKRRANSVRKYLLDAGVKHEMIVQGMGESQPVASNATKEGRALNRRVEIKIEAMK